MKQFYYVTHDKTRLNLSTLLPEEHGLLTLMLRDYGSGMHSSYRTFHNQWEGPVIQIAQKSTRFPKLHAHPLYLIELDIMANLGIQHGELQGTLSDMLVEM